MRYRTGTGQKLVGVHLPNDECYEHGCAIHAPSDHGMREFPTHWRDDRKLMERICPHGIGHPDPDHLAFMLRHAGVEEAWVDGVHGCDGCCMTSDEREAVGWNH